MNKKESETVVSRGAAKDAKEGYKQLRGYPKTSLVLVASLRALRVLQ
jgi:hypothetical protein